MEQDLNGKAKTVKFMEEKICINLWDHALGDHCLNMTPKAQITNEKIHWTSSKLKASAYQRTPSRKWEDSLQNKKKVGNRLSDKRLVSRM
jgi:hypothetical protein